MHCASSPQALPLASLPASGTHAIGVSRVNSVPHIAPLSAGAQLSSLSGVADELGAISDGMQPSLARAWHVATSPYPIVMSGCAQFDSSVQTAAARSVHALSALTLLPHPAANRVINRLILRICPIVNPRALGAQSSTLHDTIWTLQHPRDACAISSRSSFSLRS